MNIATINANPPACIFPVQNANVIPIPSSDSMINGCVYGLFIVNPPL